MNCIQCGTELTGQKTKYCSDACAKKYQRGHAKKPFKKICAYCKKLFATTKKDQKYCCKKCYSDACKKNANGQPKAAKSKDWEITALTVYLVHKWAFEGMTVDGIAKTFGCSKKRVLTAMAMPLTSLQRATLREYAMRR